MGARKADERYDAKQAYNKNLSGKARLHYLENDIADKGMSMKSPMDMKAPMDMKEGGFLQAPMDMKSPMDKKKSAAKAAASMLPAVGGGAAAGAAKAFKKSKAAKKAASMVPGVGSAAKMKAPMKKDGEIESARQEKKDLMKDNPVDKDASGKRLRGGKRSKRKPTLEEIQNRKSPKGRIYG
tara:strand:+ start:4477 stop:5022 length:546 start_codon:yes stop_codon:yes gene_type:complete